MERFHLVTIIVAILLASSASAQKLGDTCTADPDCDPTPDTTYLKCISSICKCEEGSFNFIKSQCQRFIGDDCTSQIMQPPITDNAVCDTTTRKVVCPAPYSQSKKEKICVKQHKAICMKGTVPDECDGYAFLTCSSTGICECDKKSHFSTAESACVLNAEEDCLANPLLTPEPTQTCTERSDCEPDDVGGTKCQCRTGLDPNEVDQCFAFHDSSCDTAPCNPGSFLWCQAGTCKCSRTGNDVIYDVSTRNCTVLASRQCSNKEPCTKFADCIGSVCRCGLGTVESSSGSGKCVRRFGLSCSNPPDDTQPDCDKDQFMDCQSDDTCGCNSDSWYNPEDDKCLLKADSECKFGLQPCTPYSICQYDSTDGNAKCTCESGFLRNDQGKCVKTYGSICSLNENSCDSSQYLTCDPTSFKCSCMDKEQMIYNGDTCKRRANATCSLDVGAQECVPNAQCSFERGEYRCNCRGLLTPGTAGTCVIPYDGRCGPNVDGGCDEEGYQQCDSGVGLCKCRDPSRMVYDSKFKQCRLRLGQTCSPPEEGGLFCVSGQVCGDGKRCICDQANGFFEENGACTKSANSTCVEDSDFPIDQCNSYSICEQGRCKCRSNYVLCGSYPNARCLGALNARCDNNVDDCYTAGSLVCSTNGNCECALSEQGYNSTDKSCYSFLNGKCNDGEIENGPPERCNPYAHLTCDRSGSEGTCICENGYGSLNGITCVGSAAEFAAHSLLVVFVFCFVKIIS